MAADLLAERVAEAEEEAGGGSLLISLAIDGRTGLGGGGTGPPAPPPWAVGLLSGWLWVAVPRM